VAIEPEPFFVPAVIAPQSTLITPAPRKRRARGARKAEEPPRAQANRLRHKISIPERRPAAYGAPMHLARKVLISVFVALSAGLFWLRARPLNVPSDRGDWSTVALGLSVMFAVGLFHEPNDRNP